MSHKEKMMKKMMPLLGVSMMVMSPVSYASPQVPHSLKVTIDGIDAQGFIEPQHAYCIHAENGPSEPGQNINVGVHWTAGPAETQSYALIAVDEDVPVDFSFANKNDRTIVAAQPRRPFYHWVMVNIPANITTIPVAADSKDKSVKPIGATAYGIRGINDFTSTTEIHAGYDGPCPPWNDERIHHYHFKLFALSTASIGDIGNLRGAQVMDMIKPYVLASGEVTGKYTLNSLLISQR
jgi:Raf kinase inhibitor-like YbhB/YbcL family protein